MLFRCRMIYLLFLIWIVANSSLAQQYYDPSACPEDTRNPGSRYTCNSIQQPCETFLVYRANQHFQVQNLLNISALFQMNSDRLLDLNNITSASEVLKPGREVLVPINCRCSGEYFRARLSYIVPERTSIEEIACGIFEGLLKSLTLLQDNPSQENDVGIGVRLHVPLRCACPDNVTSANGVKYLVTYAILEGDEATALSKKFGISPEDILAANRLEPKSTIFPGTTVLVPLKSDPTINLNIPDSPPPTPGFLPTITVEKTKNTKLRNLYIAGLIVGFFLVVVALLACGLYVKVLKKWKGEKLQSFADRNSIPSFSTARSSPRSGQTGRSSPRSGQTGRSSTNSCLSPDLLAGIKFSMYNYGIEDIRRATKDFDEDSKIGEEVYKGLIDNADVMIKRMKFEDTRQVIDMHSKINHINIVNLHGVCYSENDFSWSYLVFELPSNGCLRDCLSNHSNSLSWSQRTQIAFDVATGLHYLHYCIFPSYAHMSVNSRNIFLTSKWRAKLANIGSSTLAVSSSRRNDNIDTVNGWVAPEFPVHGSASEKVDIFAFGVVLLELISGREATDGNLFKESIGFLGGGASEGGCFEQLRSFIDPSLKDNYLLAEALCLAVLAKACIEDDPLRRPSMDDILKVLGRMV
ncbi:Kinase family protein / peptidoglycan-binding LysM domain-containing protein, putative [Theobroma cacao]|uniref:Kinase family protein / peptidoglycan-binding LysM domain-containing protein, putative n=1 Tax=Theobroma cacao TaxID=3641 RepID=A0A061H098_THECC|nr:Kinase family protein / peptidoglycan-binding LysM domain-containing protein, putative [Theobroma cacao]